MVHGGYGAQTVYDVQLSILMLAQYPSSIAQQLFKLGRVHGHDKIAYSLLSMGLPPQILAIMKGYLNYGKIFKVEGSDF